jgi:muramidase (phage lysozyme)
MVFDRVEFDKKAVAEFLDDLTILTNDPNDCTTAYDMFQLLKTWWKQYTNRPIVDLYEFNQYLRNLLPEHCDGKRSFVGIKFGRKLGKYSDDPEIIKMIQFMDENFETTHKDTDRLSLQEMYDAYRMWWRNMHTESVPAKEVFLGVLKRIIPEFMKRQTIVVGLKYFRQEEI